jgi:hypothetical protein
MPFGQQSQFGLGSMIGDMKKEDLQSPLYGAAQEVPSAQLQMPELGSQLRQEAPMPSLSGAESATGGASMGQVGSAGIQAASTLLGKLMEAKATREKGLRERKSEAAKTVAKSTQDALQSQMAGVANPLTNLIGAYKSVI